jgi:hypothetical protein
VSLLFRRAHLTASLIFFLRSSSKEASMPPQCGTVQSQCKALYGTGAYENGFPLSPISKQISASSKVAAIA